MQREGMSPNKFTFAWVINVCACLGALEDGRLVHEQLIQSGCESDVLWIVACLMCMQNVGAWRMLGECSTRFQLEM
jgi:hypothetical protein